MSQAVAVAIIHGIGTANPEFADKSNPKTFASGMAQKLKARFSKLMGEELEEIDSKLKIEVVYWAPVLQDWQDKLEKRLEIDRLSNPLKLRDFVFHSLADSIGYQITPSHRDIYDDVHKEFALTLKLLAQEAGEKAPLCIIGHSLGSVIASNYIWDLQNGKTQIEIGDTPLEKGETLSLFYTFGSQIALWGLRYKDFGTPITIPSPQLNQHYSSLKSEWINFYDRDDVLGYPLKKMNDKYESFVTEDREVNAGNILESWNPASHNGYWTDNEVIEPISSSLVEVWKNAYLG